MKTKVEILKETVEFYSADPSRRGLDSEFNCMYRAIKSDGTVCHCAIGRVIDPKNPNAEDAYGFYGSADSLFNRFADEILKEEYRGHELRFWRKLQHLHDTSSFWTSTGLTTSGQLKVKDLMKEFEKQDAITG